MSESKRSEKLLANGQELLAHQDRDAFIKSYIESQGKLPKQKRVRYLILSSSGKISMETLDKSEAQAALENNHLVLIVTEKVDVFEGGKLLVTKTAIDRIDNIDELY